MIVAGCIGLAGCATPANPAPVKTVPGTAATTAYMAARGLTTVAEYATSGNGFSSAALNLPQFNYVNTAYGVSLATDPAGNLYVACGSTTLPFIQIIEYPAGSSGNAAPLHVYNLSTNLVAFAVGPGGTLYVASQQIDPVSPGVNETASITVYSTENGTAVPLRTIPLANMQVVDDIAVDANGWIYVAGFPEYDDNGALLGNIDIYSSDANGSDAPLHVITSPYFLYGIGVDNNGNIYVSVGNGPENQAMAVEEFASDANGAATPINTINLPAELYPEEGGPVRFDGVGNMFTSIDSDYGYVVLGFAPGATGNATPTVQIYSGQNVYGPDLALN
jgi:hypothetical protein